MKSSIKNAYNQKSHAKYLNNLRKFNRGMNSYSSSGSGGGGHSSGGGGSSSRGGGSGGGGFR